MKDDRKDYSMSEEQTPTVRLCIDRLEMEVLEYIDMWSSEHSPIRAREFLSDASSAECAAELLRRLIPGAFESFRPSMNNWVNDWEAGVDVSPPLLCDIHPTVPDCPVDWRTRPLIGDLNQAATIEECARHLDARSLAFLRRHNSEESEPARSDWLNLHLRFHDWAKALRLLTVDGDARDRRNREKVAAFAAAGYRDRVPTLERTDNTSH
jgi:hypothetical protein